MSDYFFFPQVKNKPYVFIRERGAFANKYIYLDWIFVY
jgi:hypothetical protein